MNKSHLEHETWIIELAPHYHVVIPWILASPPNGTRVFTPRRYLDVMREQFNQIGIRIVVECFEDLSMREIFLGQSIHLVKKAPRELIITSCPETIAPRAWSIRLLALGLVGTDILCIRNLARWKRSLFDWALKTEYTFQNKLKFSVASFLTVLAEKLILFRSRKVVLESKSQLDRFSSAFPMYSAKLKMVFSGRLRVSELKKQLSISETQKGSLNKRSVIRIGVLGGISQERRNYQELLGAVREIEDSGHKVELLFLGRYVGPESEAVLDVFSPWVIAGPSRDNPEMSELFLIQIAEIIDVLISPMNPHFAYSEGWSSGSLADSDFFSKPLLLPYFIVTEYGEKAVNYYDSVESLATKIINYRELKVACDSNPTLSDIQNFIAK